MILPIDLREILRQTVADGPADLVTRRTGKAVRDLIEGILSRLDGETVLIDFASVRCLDLSCADEIVGRLLRERARERSFILVNLDEGHREAIDFVLERNNLAALAKTRTGTMEILGALAELARRTFQILAAKGEMSVEEVAQELGVTLPAASQVLEELRRRRFITGDPTGYRPPVV